MDPASTGQQGTVVIRGRFRIALSLPIWIFRALDGLSASFLIVYLLLVLVKDFIVGRFPPSSATRSALWHERRRGHLLRTSHTTMPGLSDTDQ